MTNKSLELKEKMHNQLDNVGAKFDQTQKNINSSIFTTKDKIDSKVNEMKKTISNIQSKAELLKKEIDLNFEEYKIAQTFEKAKIRAKLTEEYALMCVEVMNLAIVEANDAITESIKTKNEIEKFS